MLGTIEGIALGIEVDNNEDVELSSDNGVRPGADDNI